MTDNYRCIVNKMNSRKTPHSLLHNDANIELKFKGTDLNYSTISKKKGVLLCPDCSVNFSNVQKGKI